jgi:two-component system phosphate regulon sensor histidine kinase PhoR
VSAKGIGDRSGTRTLWWLFGTTVVAPAMLLGMMALGAFGYQQWSVVDVAEHDLALQLPGIGRALEWEARCGGPAPWEACTDAPVLDEAAVRQLEALAQSMLLPEFAQTVSLSLVPVTSPPGANTPSRTPLPGVLRGYDLVATVPSNWQNPADGAQFALAAALMLLVVGGGVSGVVLAAREIRVSERQTELLGRLSHELRTPLTSIRLFVDALATGRLPPEATAEATDLLSRETERLSRRIEEILSWARMEAGARAYHLLDTRPEDIVREAVDAFRSHHLADDPDDMSVHVHIPDDLPDFPVDRDAAVEALLNLLANVWRHVPAPREVLITAVLGHRELGLVVADNGPGITRRDRTRIFEKFYQGDAAASRDRPAPERGAGLGLSIVRAILRAHHGRVQLETRVGNGSTFTLWFPLRRAG